LLSSKDKKTSQWSECRSCSSPHFDMMMARLLWSELLMEYLVTTFNLSQSVVCVCACVFNS
jgi:hypothetical protein